MPDLLRLYVKPPLAWVAGKPVSAPVILERSERTPYAILSGVSTANVVEGTSSGDAGLQPHLRQVPKGFLRLHRLRRLRSRQGGVDSTDTIRMMTWGSGSARCDAQDVVNRLTVQMSAVV